MRVQTGNYFMRCILTTLILIVCLIAPAMAAPATEKPFPVAPHSNVTIEWWYANAHVTTQSGKHLAMIASFFRFGNAQGQVAMDSSVKTPAQSHYLIWAITDEDTGKHVAYSLGDKNTLNLLTQAAALAAMVDPKNRHAQALLQALDKGSFPPPTELIAGTAHVIGSPFDAHYGAAGDLAAIKKTPNTYRLSLNAGEDKIALTFASTKTPMYVNGNGETGIDKPSDMHYVSLSRCNVVGTIDGETVKSGQGWIDHQWGDSWTTQTVGWDWWGVQLANGTDINFFRMRDLATGKVFKPLATFQDKSGKITVTKDIIFTPDPASRWTSPRSGVTYPLNWTVTFPDQAMQMRIAPVSPDQEMPVLANGGYIWEGSCHVTADTQYSFAKGGRLGGPSSLVQGVGYQELVGYGAQAVKSANR